MSGITTVIVKTGEYKCAECLDKALDDLNLSGRLNVISERDLYKISLSEKSDNYYRHRIEKKLNLKLQKFHEKILPKYTEFHAIHSLIKKGFKHVKTYAQDNGHIMIFEKVVGTGKIQRIDRYKITVFPAENRITIDGGNMPGDYCRQYARKFQRDMGKFHSFIPYQSEEHIKIKKSVKTQERIRIGKNF
ncbi:MAG: hypothetical protein ACTSQP_07900 [Promethearchaeota archaeon]